MPHCNQDVAFSFQANWPGFRWSSGSLTAQHRGDGYSVGRAQGPRTSPGRSGLLLKTSTTRVISTNKHPWLLSPWTK